MEVFSWVNHLGAAPVAECSAGVPESGEGEEATGFWHGVLHYNSGQ